MIKFLIFVFPVLTLAQPRYLKADSALTNIYSQAIADFIKAANNKNKTNFDTLFFGRHVNGQPEDFPDIDLPGTISKTQIRVISPALGEVKQKTNRASVYINLVGWVEKEKAEFIFVVFSNGLKHQYDYYINYEYNVKRKQFDLTKVECKGPSFGK